MKFGLKVHHSDLNRLLDMRPEALEFALFADDLDGSWVKDVTFDGPIVVHMPEKFKDSTLLDPASTDDKIRSDTIRALKKTIDLSERLNARRIIFHPGGIRKPSMHVDPGPLIKTMRELQAYAPESIELLLEDMPGIYWYAGVLYTSCLFKGQEEIIGILKELNIGLCLDICHAKLYCNETGVDFPSYITALKPFTRHMHLSDARGSSEEGIQIGEGEIDLKGILPLLDDPDVIAVPEILDGHKNNGAGFRLAVDRLKSLGYFRVPL